MSRVSPVSPPDRRVMEVAAHPGRTFAAATARVPVHTMPVHSPPEGNRPNRHAIAPTVEVACSAVDVDYTPYAPYPRYRVVAKDSEGVTWVSLNSPTDEIPPPPDRLAGPVDCFCSNMDGIRGPRYGELQLETWRFCPTWLNDTRPGLPFIPDLFFGAGPCFRPDYPGVLQQWDAAWVVDGGAGVFTIRDEVAFILENHNAIDVRVLAALELRDAADSSPPLTTARSVEALKRHWDRFVGVTLERRGRALERLSRDNYWTTIKDHNRDLWYDILWAGYYDYIPLGVWVRDTPVRVKKILQLLAVGVPVYYLWREDFWDLKDLEPLAPNFSRTPHTPVAQGFDVQSGDGAGGPVAVLSAMTNGQPRARQETAYVRGA